MRVPDRLLIQAVRWIPAFMIAAIGAFVWASFGAGPLGWVLGVALLVGVGVIARAGARRAGHTRFLAGWSASRGWSAPEFEVRFLSSAAGRASRDALAEHAATYGYRLESPEPSTPVDTFVRARFIRDAGTPEAGTPE
jgi:hypothetical protein